MRRALTAVTGTVVGLIGLLSYKSGSLPTRQVAGGAAGAPGTSMAPAPAVVPGTSAPVPTTTATPGPQPTSPTTTAPAPTVMVDGAFTGPLVPTRYGPVQVRVTVSGDRVVEVTALILPSERARSAAISNRAAPILRSEALAAQGATIDTVSGATYTSAGYAASMQAALDAARR